MSVDQLPQHPLHMRNGQEDAGKKELRARTPTEWSLD